MATTINNTNIVFIMSHLENKCHLMLAAVYIDKLNELNEEELRQEYELELLNARMAQQLRMSWIDAQLDQVNWEHPYSINHEIPTGDRALDDEEYCSDMEDCLIACEETEVYTTEELTDISDEEMAKIDWTEEINLNDMYYNCE